jgi:hypothetical protein
MHTDWKIKVKEKMNAPQTFFLANERKMSEGVRIAGLRRNAPPPSQWGSLLSESQFLFFLGSVGFSIIRKLLKKSFSAFGRHSREGGNPVFSRHPGLPLPRE